MRLIQRLKDISSIFFDTAPIIYYIEAHADYGPLVSDVVRSFQSGQLRAFFFGYYACRSSAKTGRHRQ